MISMYDYFKKIIDKFPEDMIGHKPTAALEYLFKTNGTNTGLLDRAKGDEYHSLTATVLYLGMRTGVDLQPATRCLCTWVKVPDKHDWKTRPLDEVSADNCILAFDNLKQQQRIHYLC